jgi:hypothetical protein
MYALEAREHVDGIFKKLAKRDPIRMEVVVRKM